MTWWATWSWQSRADWVFFFNVDNDEFWDVSFFSTGSSSLCGPSECKFSQKANLEHIVVNTIYTIHTHTYACSAVASQQECCGFNSKAGLSVWTTHVLPVSLGFQPGTPAQSEDTNTRSTRHTETALLSVDVCLRLSGWGTEGKEVFLSFDEK